MEELVGRLWHQFITRAASEEHETARVHQVDMRRAIELLFRAAGGSSAVRLREATAQQRGGPRSPRRSPLSTTAPITGAP